MVNPHVQAANVSKYDYKLVYDGYHVSQATLALTYSQDTANLIAWYTSGKSYIRDDEALRKEIHKRLGLDE